ncbi:hypothetical protein KVT40_003315 [Elsinoe batatas]|uniref:Uncharacterized protein n=1 Tax=Elsinoe batatas TaxID=2601811 RepID=A0A8K0L5V6_9PEZI|nr:hypothetical protein KVT40_003315 [Elsinoe batatas]
MPPYLHPRSRSTSTLFTGCLAVSFLVVGMPHLLPCPVDRRQFTENGEVVPKRKRKLPSTQAQSIDMEKQSEDAASKRECPVPKPRGFVGQLLGFRQENERGPMEVVVKPLSARTKKTNRQDGT